MARYGDLIRKARESDSQKTIQSDEQIDGTPDDQIASKQDRQLDPRANEQSILTQITEPDHQIARQPEREVNLCVKVPESLRRHWAAEAKRAGITMTEIMVEALTHRFGKPDDHKTK